jgi:ElaB/YqjD/DUF883 family membrane-anchored ribosome-binding protein
MERSAEALAARSDGGSISQMSKAVSPDLEQLTRDFRTFVADCETLLKNATTLSGAGATVARAQLSDRMATAKVKLDAMRMNAGDRAARTRATTEDYVRREPMKALGYAVAAGAILGMLISRR